MSVKNIKMVNCAVINCKNCTNARRNNKADLSFHRFPHEPNLKQKWIEATENKDWFPTKQSTICSIHFEEASFVEGKQQRIFSKAAYPTVDVLKITTDEVPVGYFLIDGATGQQKADLVLQCLRHLNESKNNGRNPYIVLAEIKF